MKRTVLIAQNYDPSEMGSFGKASYMILTQYNFPFNYDDDLDKIISADDDRIFSWDYSYARKVYNKYLKTGELHLREWCTTNKPEKVLAFCKEILKADTSIDWNGYRILYTVNRSNGYPVFSIQLFYKHPDSDTKVYSKIYDVPNVEKIENIFNDKGFYYENLHR
jgi:hypothetical protein